MSRYADTMGRLYFLLDNLYYAMLKLPLNYQLTRLSQNLTQYQF